MAEQTDWRTVKHDRLEACSDEHWKWYPRRAGWHRNRAMLDLDPVLVIAFTDGSRGTQLTIDEAVRRGISVEVIGGGAIERLNWPEAREPLPEQEGRA